jgi:hypothetical protein
MISKNNKVKLDIYDPTPGTNEISMMRSEFMGDQRCKSKALEMANPNKRFRGFCLIESGVIRTLGNDVVDSRKYFCGHAHIALAVQSPSSATIDPATPEAVKRFQDMKKELKAKSLYLADPHPEKAHWMGGTICKENPSCRQA